MAVQVGRSVGKYFAFDIEDIGHVMRQIPVNTLGGLGIADELVDQSALQDAMKGWLKGHGDMPLTIGGPYDTKAAVAAAASGAAPALSGSHTVLAPLSKVNVPGNFGIRIGIGHYWETGEPCFKIDSPAATDGIVVASYIVDPAAMRYTAQLRLVPGSKAPDWYTTIAAVAA